VTKSEFERRAAEMKARNLTRPRFRMLSPPRSIFAPPLATPSPATVYVHDFLREVDIKRLSPTLAAIRKLPARFPPNRFFPTTVNAHSRFFLPDGMGELPPRRYLHANPLKVLLLEFAGFV
jgi:hypothetical protein